MAKERKKKEEALREFAKSEDGKKLKRQTNDKLEFEEGFREYVKKQDWYIGAYGKESKDNNLEGSANYTRKLAEKLGYSFYDDNEDYEDEDCADSISNKSNYSSNKQSSGLFDSLRERISNAGNTYTSKSKTYSRKGKDFNFGSLDKGPLFWAIVLIIGLIAFYLLFGATIYDFIIGIKLKKVISWIFAVLATIGILRGKNMGWPIYIKIIAIFVIWLVMFNI